MGASIAQRLSKLPKAQHDLICNRYVELHNVKKVAKEFKTHPLLIRAVLVFNKIPMRQGRQRDEFDTIEEEVNELFRRGYAPESIASTRHIPVNQVRQILGNHLESKSHKRLKREIMSRVAAGDSWGEVAMRYHCSFEYVQAVFAEDNDSE